jgi:hypothetical protein
MPTRRVETQEMLASSFFRETKALDRLRSRDSGLSDALEETQHDPLPEPPRAPSIADSFAQAPPRCRSASTGQKQLEAALNEIAPLQRAASVGLDAPGTAASSRFRRSTEPASDASEDHAETSTSASWRSLYLGGLDPAQQTVAICQVIAQLREAEDWTGVRTYLALVGKQMAKEVLEIDSKQTRKRVKSAAQDARLLVDESLDTISIASLRLWSERRLAGGDLPDEPVHSGRSSAEIIRSIEEGTYDPNAAGTEHVPEDCVEFPNLIDTAAPPLIVKRSRIMRAWNIFCAFLDAGPR